MFSGRRFAPKWSGVAAAAVLCVAGCGGGGNHGDEAAAAGDEGGRVVALDVDPSSAPEALVAEAAREHGAPGENEPVRFRLRGPDPALVHTSAEALRAHGFHDIDAE